MPRTEKRFGVVNQPTASTPTELVPTAVTTRNLLLHATGRGSASISAAIYSGAYSSDANQNVTISSAASAISVSNLSTVSTSFLRTLPFGNRAGENLHYGGTGSSGFVIATDPQNGSAKYQTTSITQASGFYWTDGAFRSLNIKSWAGGSNQYAQIGPAFVPISSTQALGVGANTNTSTAGNLLYNLINISHVTGTSISVSATTLGATAYQGVTGSTSGRHSAAAYALQDGVGFILHSGEGTPTGITSGRTMMGMYIYGPSSTAFEKRAYWNGDGTSGKTSGYLLTYFFASDYNSQRQVFAFSQPSTTTLWSGISPTSSTSWPAGYTIPSEAAPAGFRIVSNSGTTDPTTNFLTGTITYPAAPTGVTVPSGQSQPATAAIKFSPSGERLAVAYSRNYSGTGDTNSVVVVYTRQDDGSWAHTHSSGSNIRYMPDTQDSMVWSDDSSTIAISGSTSTTSANRGIGEPYVVDLWNIGTGVSVIPNTKITSWSVLSQDYPPFNEYIDPNSGSSYISSLSIASVSATTLVGTSGNYVVNGIQKADLTSSAFGFALHIEAASLSQYPTMLSYRTFNTIGTVGNTSSHATNYVSTVLANQPIQNGESIQVSNIIINNGERVFVESTSNSVDISAHGIEIT